MRKLLVAAALALLSTPLEAQRQPPAPVLLSIDALRADFAIQSGGSTVYFAEGSEQLTAQSATLLAAQAMWLRRHPELVVRVEGHGDQDDTRDHALAVGAARAEAARDYLLLLGIPAAQVSAMSWGKEKMAPPSAVTVLVR